MRNPVSPVILGLLALAPVALAADGGPPSAPAPATAPAQEKAKSAPPVPRNLPRTVVRPRMFADDRAFEEWMRTYHADPRPDMLDEAFVYFVRSAIATDEAKRVEAAAFFGAALSRTPGMISAVRDAMVREASYDALFAFVNALWLCDTDASREMLRTMAENEPDKRVREFIARRAQLVSPLAEERAIESLSQINLLWAQFGATGDPRIAERVAGVILTHYQTSPQATIFQDAARESLRSRGGSAAVREGLRRAIEKADNSPLKDDAVRLLDEMTAAAAPGPSPQPGDS